MTGINSSHSVRNSFSQGVDKQANDYINQGDEKLKEVAERVSTVFLNQNFYTICCCNYPLSIQEIVKNNPNFLLMDKEEINRSMNLLAFNKHKDLIDHIVNKLSTDNAISNLCEAIEWLKFYSDRYNKYDKTSEAQEYDDILQWALNRQFDQFDMVTNSEQADKAARSLLSSLPEVINGRAIDEMLSKVVSKTSEEFLNDKFYQLCDLNLILSLEEVVNNNDSFSQIDRREVIKSAPLLAKKKHKDLIEKITFKIPIRAVSITKVLKPSFIFIDSVISQLKSSDEEYKEMLEWAEKLRSSVYVIQQHELDKYTTNFRRPVPINGASISVPLSDVLESCIIS